MTEKAMTLPDASSGPRSARSIVSLGEGGKFTPEQVELIKRTVCRGASDDELALFLHVAQRSGLDPFAKQIYAIKRRAKVDGQWREVMTIQTGIDGFRVVAGRTSAHAGTDDAVFVEDEGHPRSATVTVWKIVGGKRVPFTATARWDEYVQTYEDRDSGKAKPMGLWGKMPYTMLAKCAESLALRKAFPMDLSGIYSQEEMAQADRVGEDLADPPLETVARPIDAAPERPATTSTAQAGTSVERGGAATTTPTGSTPVKPPAAAAPAPEAPRATKADTDDLGRAWTALIERILARGLDQGHENEAQAAGKWLRGHGLDLAPVFAAIKQGGAAQDLVVAAAAKVRELMTKHLPIEQPPEPVAAAATAPGCSPGTTPAQQKKFDDDIPF